MSVKLFHNWNLSFVVRENEKYKESEVHDDMIDRMFLTYSAFNQTPPKGMANQRYCWFAPLI